MNWMDFILLGLVALWGIAVVRHLYRQKKQGKCNGCGGCDGAFCSACRQNQPFSEKKKEK